MKAGVATMGSIWMMVAAISLALSCKSESVAMGGNLKAPLQTIDAEIVVGTETEILQLELRKDRLWLMIVALGNDRVIFRVTDNIARTEAEERVAKNISSLNPAHDADELVQTDGKQECPARFHPQVVEPKGEAFALVGLYADERLELGVCSDEVARYHATVGYFYEESQQRLVRVEYYAANDGVDMGADIVRSFHMKEAGVAHLPSREESAGTPTKSAWVYHRSPEGNEKGICKDCNLLLISMDIFRPDHMECMGHHRQTSSNICQMVGEGTSFENFIVQAHQTPVSQMSLLTGRYPSSTGYVSFTSQLDSSIPYLPQVLKNAGYGTVAMGSSYEVMSNMSEVPDGKKSRFNGPNLKPVESFQRGFDRFVFTGSREVPTDAIPWIAEQGDDKFFLWLMLGTLHWPYGFIGDPDQQSMFDPPDYDGPLLRQRCIGFRVLSKIYQDRFYDLQQGTVTALDAADAAFINARYDFGLWYVDQFIGDLMAAMPPEVMENTLIVLHGVHGEDLGQHDYFGHYDIFDTEIRNTVIVLDPKQRTQGYRVKEQVEGVDLTPTLLELLGLPPIANAEGTSFAATVHSGHGDPDRIAFTERLPLWEDIYRYRNKMPEDYVQKISPIMDSNTVGDTGLRTVRWKLIHRRARHIESRVSWWAWLSDTSVERQEWELYDLVDDPTETNNVILQHAEVAKDLQAELLAWEDKMGMVSTAQMEGQL